VTGEEFIALAFGTLLSRNKNGKIIIGDTINAHRAIKEAENGNDVILTVDGKPFSIISKMNETLL